jgi:hypothetical protein
MGQRNGAILMGALVALASGEVLGADEVRRSWGQTLYVAAYSHVFMAEQRVQFPVASTVVVRNTDPSNPILVTAVDYRDSKGKHLHHYVENPITVDALSSVEFSVTESDQTGGHSPSIIVRWEAMRAVNAPVVETLVIGARSGQSISFIGRARVIEESSPTESP